MRSRPPRRARSGAEAPFWEPSSPPRMLLVVNPKATAVSSRLKNLVMYALRGRYDLDFVETEGPNHATELGREAVRAGYDLVVSFGGDGTLNETANGLAGSDIPLAMLPGGASRTGGADTLAEFDTGADMSRRINR